MSVSFVSATGSVLITGSDAITINNFPVTNAGDFIVFVLGTYTTPSQGEVVNDIFNSNYSLLVREPQSLIEIWGGFINGSGSTRFTTEWTGIDIHSLIIAEYSGVTGSGNSSSIHGTSTTASIQLSPLSAKSLMVVGFSKRSATDPNFYPVNQGALRLSITGSTIGSALLDTPWPNTLINTVTGSPSWTAAAIELLVAPGPPGPVQLPAAVFKTPVVSSINRSKMDKLYPYRTLQVTPTNLKPLPFICPHCKTPSSAVIYRDVRDYAVSVGIPNVRSGGIPNGQSFDFIYCGACLRWYRKNDYKQIPALAIIDVGINPRLNTIEDIGVGPPDEPEYFSTQENLVGDDVRILLQSDVYGFTDFAFERTGFIVKAVPTGSIEPS